MRHHLPQKVLHSKGGSHKDTLLCTPLLWDTPYVLCQAQVPSEAWFLGLRILCHRNDWLPVEHLYVPTCSMVVESLLEALRKKARFGFVLLQVVSTNVFCMCLLCKGVHGECARMRANILWLYTTDICGYPRALMPRI